MKILLQNSIFWPNVIGGAEISSHLLGEQFRQLPELLLEADLHRADAQAVFPL